MPFASVSITEKEMSKHIPFHISFSHRNISFVKMKFAFRNQTKSTHSTSCVCTQCSLQIKKRNKMTLRKSVNRSKSIFQHFKSNICSLIYEKRLHFDSIYLQNFLLAFLSVSCACLSPTLSITPLCPFLLLPFLAFWHRSSLFCDSKYYFP